jgi:HSP20 family protein
MALVPVQQRNKDNNLTTPRQHPLSLLRREIDSLFERFFGEMPPFSGDFGSLHAWDFGVTESDKELVVRADVPGFEEEELEVTLSNDVLTIKAQKDNKGDGRQEYRRFYRSITLPSGIDTDKVKATYRNGVLELHIPRPEGSRGKRIPIRAQEALEDNGAHAGEEKAPRKGKK